MRAENKTHKSLITWLACSGVEDWLDYYIGGKLLALHGVREWWHMDADINGGMMQCYTEHCSEIEEQTLDWNYDIWRAGVAFVPASMARVPIFATTCIQSARVCWQIKSCHYLTNLSTADSLPRVPPIQSRVQLLTIKRNSSVCILIHKDITAVRLPHPQRGPNFPASNQHEQRKPQFSVSTNETLSHFSSKFSSIDKLFRLGRDTDISYVSYHQSRSSLPRSSFNEPLIWSFFFFPSFFLFNWRIYYWSAWVE